MKIGWSNETQYPVDSERLGSVIERYLAKRPDLNIIELSVVLVNPDTARALNQRCRKQDLVPAVLTFPAPVNEIIICPEQARKKGHTVQFLLRHGLDHLTGKPHL